MLIRATYDAAWFLRCQHHIEFMLVIFPWLLEGFHRGVFSSRHHLHLVLADQTRERLLYFFVCFYVLLLQCMSISLFVGKLYLKILVFILSFRIRKNLRGEGMCTEHGYNHHGEQLADYTYRNSP